MFGKSGSQCITNSKQTAETLRLDHQLLSNNELTNKYPFLTIGNGNECVLQVSKCGMINPRKLVMAQKRAASLQGCHIFNAIVNEITESRQRSGAKILELITEDGRIIQARKVLLCTGGFTLTKPLLSTYLLPDLRLVPTQTLRLELSSHDMKRVEGIPMMSSGIGGNSLADCYVCPPVVYPDGNYGLLC